VVSPIPSSLSSIGGDVLTAARRIANEALLPSTRAATRRNVLAPTKTD
jgi:hypothetical protein